MKNHRFTFILQDWESLSGATFATMRHFNSTRLQRLIHTGEMTMKWAKVERVSFDDGWMPHIEDGACISVNVRLDESNERASEYWSIEEAKSVLLGLKWAIERAEDELERCKTAEPWRWERQKQRYQESQIPAWVNPKRVG
jgi:hypothetical protein